ncbi:uncharacterized protein LOC127862049 [Dreissena polymorpha]|uniref:B box-type domain-containing protein n=1 Tax=Dreissena polymorpha TaxID=45954 RepID=A0A9D4S752_DREPO|nr:uncharacterized protein LOC127862049 [Dreissena polymorpha]KAH3894121.1 hypothetical protein DPMN_018279 [Dreissena polymorpha]
MSLEEYRGKINHERKISTLTVASDSGISCSTPEEIIQQQEYVTMDMVIDSISDRPVRTRNRVSADVYLRRKDVDMGTLLGVKRQLSNRYSRSLPDILDIDNIDPINDPDIVGNELNKTSDSSDPNVSFEENGVKVDNAPRSLNSPVTVCGREHLEDPCYICMKDNEIYCSVCIEVHNVHCREKVKFIPDIPSEFRQKYCADATEELVIMKRRFIKIKEENEELREKLNVSKRAFIKSLMKYKNSIIAIVDRMEKEALLEMDTIFSNESAKIQTNIENLEREIRNLESHLTALKGNDFSDGSTMVFTIQEALNQLHKDEIIIRTNHKMTNHTEFIFEGPNGFIERLAGLDELWKVSKSTVERCKVPMPCNCDKPYEKKTAVKEKEVSVRLSGWSFDRERCCITACEFLNNGKLLLCDNANKKLKLFSKKFKCVSMLSLPSLPWDIAVIDDSRAAVTMPDKKQLQFIQIQDRKLSNKETITLEHNCWGVACNNDILFVTCWSREATSIIVIDAHGAPTREITTAGGVPFHTPWFIAFHNQTLYVSDWGTYTVNCLTTTGTQCEKYRHSLLVGPLGVTHDPDGNLYICSRDSNTIHQLSPTGSLIRILLTEKDGIAQPLNICHRKTDDRLVVTSWMSDKITVYKIS